jgi:hypothetical protein
MAEKPNEETTYAMPCGLLAFAVVVVVVIGLVSALHWIGVVVLSQLALVGIVVGVLYASWFPRRATVEFNKVIKTIPGQARLVRRKCRREGDQWLVAWKVPTGVTVAGLKRMTGVFEVALDCSCDFWFDRGIMWMRAGTSQLPELLKFEEFYARPRPAGELVIGVGIGRKGPVWVDLPALPHLLDGGTPGSGKSVFLRQVLVGLATKYEPEYVRVLLIDLKGGMEFHMFRELPHLLGPVVSDMPELMPALENLIAEMDRRMDMFREAGVVSLRHWNESRPADRLPYIVAFIDEFGEVSRPVAESSIDKARGPSLKAVAHGAFSRLARLGRAVGIHIIASTQRPDADVMPGQIKDQLPATIAFRTRSETNSHILLGDKNAAAANLPPIKGRAIFQFEDEVEVQAPFIEPAAALALLRERCVQPVGHARVTQCPTSPQEFEPGRAA